MSQIIVICQCLIDLLATVFLSSYFLWLLFLPKTELRPIVWLSDFLKHSIIQGYYCFIAFPLSQFVNKFHHRELAVLRSIVSFRKKKALSGGRELITVEKMHKKIHETLMKRALQTASNDKTKYLNIAWDAKKQQKDLIYEGALVKQKL